MLRHCNIPEDESDTMAYPMLFLSVVFPTLVVAVDVKLQVSPDTLQQSAVHDVSVECTVKPERGDTIETIRLLKISDFDMGVIAEIDRMNSPPITFRIGVEANGNINPSGSGEDDEEKSYIRAVYETKRHDIYGKYRCAVLYSRNSDVYQKNANIEIGQNFGMLDRPVDSLPSALDSETEHRNHKMPKGVSNIRTMIWPRGTYGLMMPDYGCPGEDVTEWKPAVRKYHTESSSDENQDQASSGTHLRRPIFEVMDGQNIVNSHFCMKLTDLPGPQWPNGSYCINKKGDCPRGFSSGSIKWDEEDTDHLVSKVDPLLPDGVYARNTLVNYCCRNDASPYKEIFLPYAEPFYLYRFGGVCQKVHDMSVSNEYVVYDTENDAVNIDSYSNEYHPDGQLRNVRLELCYYKHVC